MFVYKRVCLTRKCELRNLKYPNPTICHLLFFLIIAEHLINLTGNYVLPSFNQFLNANNY